MPELELTPADSEVSKEIEELRETIRDLEEITEMVRLVYERVLSLYPHGSP